MIGVMCDTLTKQAWRYSTRDDLWNLMLEFDSVDGKEIVRRRIEAGRVPRRGGRRPRGRTVHRTYHTSYRLANNAMPLPEDREVYWVPVVHDHGYWAPIPDMAGQRWPDDLIIEVKSTDNPCKPGSDTWVLWNLLVLHKYHGKTIRDWKVMDDPDRRNTIGQYRRMAMHQMRYFVRNGWVWLRRPEHKEDRHDGSA